MLERHRFKILAAFLVVACGSPLLAVEVEEGDTDQTVARVAYLQGSATYNRGDDPDDWQAAQQNFPLTSGDRFWTSRDARAELQVVAGTVILAPETDLSVLNLTEDVSRLSVGAGTASFRIRHLLDDDSFEVATPNAAVTFLRPGYYRVDVDASGNTRVAVFKGEASVAAAGGQVRLEAGDAIHVEGLDAPKYDVTDIPHADSWDRWVEKRARRYRSMRPQSEGTAAALVGIDDLDEYGRWEEIPSYGRVWTPAVVEVGWVPYRVGSWVWRDPWGWTWVSSEPWGWAPYHYGRWVTWSSRWYWVPDPPSVRVRWAPAYVGFVGGGPGWSVSIGAGGGYVGWFPLAPREPFVPWWGRPHADVSVHATNVTYVNRSYVTVVKHETFVSGAPVVRNVVRERDVIRRISTAPVARGPLPMIPGHASLHVGTSVVTAPRPPAPVLSRSVVSRRPPPPTPMAFQERHENARPAPAAPAPRAATAPPQQQVRPAQAERMRLEPRGQQLQRRKAEPLKTEAPPKRKEVSKEAPKKHEERKEQ